MVPGRTPHSPGSRLLRPITAFQLTVPAGTLGSPAPHNRGAVTTGRSGLAIALGAPLCCASRAVPALPTARLSQHDNRSATAQETRPPPTCELGAHRPLLASLHLSGHLQQVGAVGAKGAHVQACGRVWAGRRRQGDAEDGWAAGHAPARRSPAQQPHQLETLSSPWQAAFLPRPVNAPCKGSVRVLLSAKRW